MRSCPRLSCPGDHRGFQPRILYLSSLKRSHKEGKSTTAGALTVRVESLQNSKLAFALRGQETTNTYQAILSMDGSRSYALFLYQSGGMQWNVSGRPGNPVLMGFSSGDGYFKNSQLTSHPVWEKYRPDQFLDSNSGLRGLQIYKLHREKKPNYRLRCLQWLKRQPQWPSWGWNQISCPCSWIQGVLDLRFQFSGGSRQLCSFSSWRGGVCCCYGPWGELLQGWKVQSPWQLDQELELPFQQQALLLCPVPAKAAPPPSAALGSSPQDCSHKGRWSLDGRGPSHHHLGWCQLHLQWLGDFLLVWTQDRNSSFLLQGRTAQTHSANATNFIGFAAEYRSSSLHPITVQWLLKPNNTIHVQLNNQSIAFETNCEDTKDQEIFSSSGVIMTHYSSTVSASFDGAVAVAVSVLAISHILHTSCSLSKGYQSHTEGLTGFWNGNPDDDFRMPNGSTILKRSSEEMLFHYGMTWKINGTSLFGKRDDHLPSASPPSSFHNCCKTQNCTEFKLFALEKPFLCQNKSCPEEYWYNNGLCSVSHTVGCQPVCTCPSAFTDARCFPAGNNFTPTIHQELPLRIIQLSLTEDENASQADVNVSVAYRLKNLELWAFLWNRQVDETKPSTAPASGSSLHHWNIISEFQYRPEGPVIDFLNNQPLDVMVKVFLPPAPQMRGKRSGGPRNNVAFHSISRKDVYSVMALNVSMLAICLQCNGYKDYRLVYSPQGGFTCVSPCSQGYCKHGGQCQHLPDGPRCSCVPSSICTPWGKRCEQLSMKLGAFFRILLGTLGAILLLGVAVFLILRFRGSWAGFPYPLDSES
ncbi:hypothetical protein R6Z07F_001460 [Ovis aries]